MQISAITNFAIMLAQGSGQATFNTKGVPSSVLVQIETELQAIPFGKLIEYMLENGSSDLELIKRLEVTDTWFEHIFNYGRQG